MSGGTYPFAMFVLKKSIKLTFFEVSPFEIVISRK